MTEQPRTAAADEAIAALIRVADHRFVEGKPCAVGTDAGCTCGYHDALDAIGRWQEAQARPAVASEGLRAALDEIEALLPLAKDAPWVWLDGDGENADELQDGHGEMVATGFLDNVTIDGETLTTDGRLCAALRNAASDLIAAARAALASDTGSVGALDVERLTAAYSEHRRYTHYGRPWVCTGGVCMERVAAAYDAERQGES